MNIMYKTTVNPSPPHKHAVDNDDDGALLAHAPAYSGEHTPAPGHTVESERAWNAWFDASFDIAMEGKLIPAVGDALGEVRKQLRDEIKELRNQIAELKRELAQARADSVVTLPRSAWKSNAA